MSAGACAGCIHAANVIPHQGQPAFLSCYFQRTFRRVLDFMAHSQVWGQGLVQGPSNPQAHCKGHESCQEHESEVQFQGWCDSCTGIEPHKHDVPCQSHQDCMMLCMPVSKLLILSVIWTHIGWCDHFIIDSSEAAHFGAHIVTEQGLWLISFTRTQ